MCASFHIGPRITPTAIKVLIWVTALVSLLTPILSFSLRRYFGPFGLNFLLALSLPGIKLGFVWQLVTYIFIQSIGTGITLGLLISLFFFMLLLWFSGSELIFRFGSVSFIIFYLGAGVFAGACSLAYLATTSHFTVIAGATPAVYACLVGWAMLFPNFELFLFFIVRIKAKWLVLIVLGISLLMSLSGNFALFFNTLGGIVWGYLFCVTFWKLHSPFPWTFRFDHFMNNLFRRR